MNIVKAIKNYIKTKFSKTFLRTYQPEKAHVVNRDNFLDFVVQKKLYMINADV